jgi:hypothetical protein
MEISYPNKVRVYGKNPNTLCIPHISHIPHHTSNGTISTDAVITLGTTVEQQIRKRADIDENGYVNALDARMIMRAAAGAIEL